MLYEVITDPGALVALDELAREDRHRHPEQRRDGALPDQPAVALVVGVRRDADAGGQKLRPRGRDLEAPAALDAEAQAVERSLDGAILV